jgi:hypothetical protein
MSGAGRKGAQRTHCFRGHPLTAENVRLVVNLHGWGPSVSRSCTVCARARHARWRHSPAGRVKWKAAQRRYRARQKQLWLAIKAGAAA